MLRMILRGGGLLTLVLLLVPAGFAKSPAKSKVKKHKQSDTAAETSVSDAKAGATASPESTPSSAAAVPAQKVADNKGKNGEEQPAPRFTPMLATTGTVGLFTVETADTLPKGAIAGSAYGNKFGRMPGSITVLQLGIDLSYGITDSLNVYGAFNPYGHVHVSNPCQLSLAPFDFSNNCFFPGPLFPNTIYRTLSATGTPGYVQDFPFAGKNQGGIGDVTLGLKFGLLSERRGDPFSLSVRNDFIISTKNNLASFLTNGTQGSPLSDMVSIAVSKTWRSVITTTLNTGYKFVRDPRDDQGQPAFHMPDQFRVGAGYLLFPDKRIQPMAEYSAVIFTSSGKGLTPDTTFGARDPVDGVWGVRVYPWKQVAIDAGYRHMVNLSNSFDRHGFVVKVGTAFWPEKPAPVNHPPSASCSTDKGMVYLDSRDVVAVTVTASDPDNDPLTYTWSASGGAIDGDGPHVRWNSAGVAVGTYKVTVHVDDGRGGSASCSADIRVEPKPNHPPVIACSADRSPVFAGERVHITCNASDPDGDPLTYTWRANAGKITGSGPAGDFDTTGLSPASYTITTRVEDGRGGAAEASTAVEVKAVPPPPQASKISDCAFGMMQSSRIDNVCKRILDDVALRLQSDPRASAVIVGYSDPKERRPDKVAGDRATNAVKYLGEKGIDPSRITTRTGTGQAGADQQNRRIDVIWVPEGATY